MEQEFMLASELISPTARSAPSPQKTDELRNEEHLSPETKRDSPPKLPLIPSTIGLGLMERISGYLNSGMIQEHSESTNVLMPEGQNMTAAVSGKKSSSYWEDKACQLEQQLEKATLTIKEWHDEAEHVALELERLEIQYNRMLEAHRPNLVSKHQLSDADIMNTFMSLSHSISVFSDDACHILGVDETEINHLLYQLYGGHVKPLWKILDVITHANHVIVAFIFAWLIENIFPSDRPSDHWAPNEESLLIFKVEKLLSDESEDERLRSWLSITAKAIAPNPFLGSDRSIQMAQDLWRDLAKVWSQGACVEPDTIRHSIHASVVAPAVEFTRELRLCKSKVWFENIPAARTVRGPQTQTEASLYQSTLHQAAEYLELSVAPSLMATRGGRVGASKETQKLVREKTVNLNVGKREDL